MSLLHTIHHTVLVNSSRFSLVNKCRDRRLCFTFVQGAFFNLWVFNRLRGLLINRLFRLCRSLRWSQRNLNLLIDGRLGLTGHLSLSSFTFSTSRNCGDSSSLSNSFSIFLKCPRNYFNVFTAVRRDSNVDLIKFYVLPG
jgi:hypothetical protein